MDHLYQAVQSQLHLLQQQMGFPGATCAYSLPDGMCRELAVGFADQETQRPMTIHSRMLAASIGKTFVALTIIALAHEKQLNVDDLLSIYLHPYHWYVRLANHETITLRQLLTHSSGLKDHVHTNNAHTEKVLERLSRTDTHISPELLIHCILDEPPLFAAGQGWAYTDTGYILLGLVIEQITGSTYYEELERRFLKPLSLNSTTPSNAPYLPDLVPGYTSANNLFALPEKTMDEKGVLVWNPAVEWTGGGLVSTSRDLARWAKILYEGHALQFDYLPDLLCSVPLNDETSRRYGAGVVITPNSPHGVKYGHLGVIPGYISSMQYYPKQGVALAFQVNTDKDVKMLGDIEQALAECLFSGRKREKR